MELESMFYFEYFRIRMVLARVWTRCVKGKYICLKRVVSGLAQNTFYRTKKGAIKQHPNFRLKDLPVSIEIVSCYFHVSKWVGVCVEVIFFFF